MLIHNADITGSLTINGVPYNTGSFTGSFYGDGSQLSGVTSYTNADTLAFIQGYSGSYSGSFSGSFFGDGSNLSGVTSYTDADTLAFINSLDVVSGSIQTVSTVSDTFTSATSYTVTHNFGTKEVIVSVYENDILIFPSSITTPTTNTVTITFPEPVTGRVVVVKAGHIVSGSINYNSVLNKPTLVSGSSQITYSGLTGIPSGIVSGSSQISFTGITNKPTLVSGSSQITYSGLTGIPSGIVSGSSQVAQFGYATTGSNQFKASQSITGSLTVTGAIVAQTLNVQQVTSSIVYSSGSNIFGNSLGNTQQFTGSVSVTGSLAVGGVTNIGTRSGGNIRNLNIYGATNANAIIKIDGADGNGYGAQIDFVSKQTGGTSNTWTLGTGINGGTNAFELYNGSSTSLSINLNGSVGIGVTSPSAELQVGKSSDVTIAMSNSSSVTSGNRGGIAWYNSNVSTVANIRAVAVTDNVGTELQFYTRPAAGSLTQAMTLDANGRLGIGTTSQRGVLDISSGLRTGTLSGLFIGADSDTTAGTRTNNTRKIGMIASPHYENASSSVFGISMDNQVSNNFIYIGGGYSGYNAATAIAFSTGGTTTTETGTERMRINSSGSVGIGTPSPSSLLEVAGGGVFSLQLSGNLTDATRKFAFIQGKHYTNSEEPIAMIGIDSQASVSTLYIGGGLTSGLNAATEISFQTGATNTTLTGTQRMHIASGGLVTVTGTGAGQTSEGIFFKRTSNLAQGGYISGNGGALNIVATNEYSSANGAIYFQRYNGTTTTPSMIIDGNGVVLINNTYASPYGVLNTYKLPVNSTYVDQIVVQGAGNYPSLRLGTYDQYDGVIATTGNDLRILAGLDVYSEDHNIRFYTSFNGGSGGAQAYERMRITHDNNVLFNTTSTGTTNSSSFIFRSGTGAYSGVMVINHATTNNTGAGFIDCYYNTNYIGGIQQNGTSNVSFSTSSDYRLKEDLKDFNGLNLISNLKVYDFKWKTENSRMYGVIAHELQEIIPYTVSGNKDEIKENGKIKVQVVDYSKLVPVLVKAIQEQQSQIEILKAENDTLKSRIDTLEQA
jgi:hypothetical protein